MKFFVALLLANSCCEGSTIKIDGVNEDAGSFEMQKDEGIITADEMPLMESPPEDVINIQDLPTLQQLEDIENDLIAEDNVQFITPQETFEMIKSENPTDVMQVDEHAEVPPTTVIASGETQNVELHDGSFFLLMMTIVEAWRDDYMNKESKSFKNLSHHLGSELIDFIDNSQESREPNVTDFKLVEVHPSSDSLEKIYVTFIVSSKREISGEDLSIALSNRINIHGGFYEFKATFDGFVLKNISKEEGERDFGSIVMCESGKVRESSAIEVAALAILILKLPANQNLRCRAHLQ